MLGPALSYPVRHGRYVTFQMAEVAVSRRIFGQILSLIARSRRWSLRERQLWEACALMTGNTVISGMRPSLLSVMAASGALYRHASGSILPSRAQIATLILRTDGHLGNVG